MVVSPHPQGLLEDREFRLICFQTLFKTSCLSFKYHSVPGFFCTHFYSIEWVFFHCSRQKHLFSSNPLRSAILQLTGMLLLIVLNPHPCISSCVSWSESIFKLPSLLYLPQTTVLGTAFFPELAFTKTPVVHFRFWYMALQESQHAE